MSQRLASCLLAVAVAAAGGCAVTDEARREAAPQARAEAGPDRYTQGIAHMRAGNFAAAAAVWESLISDSPADADTLANLGIAYMETGRQEEAKAAFNKALTIEPAHPEASVLLAIEHRLAGRFNEAETLYRRLLQVHPDYALGHLNYGILCDLYLRESQCALEHYQRYQALSDDREQEVANWIADLEQQASQ